MRPYCAHVCILEWQAMSPKGVFKFIVQKFIFHFLSVKNGFFCEAATKNVLPKWANPFFINSRPRFMYNSPIVCISKLSRHLSAKRQIYVDLVGTEPNLNYMCFIGCSWFFPKIIFKFKTCYFIRDPLRFLQDSTHS